MYCTAALFVHEGGGCLKTVVATTRSQCSNGFNRSVISPLTASSLFPRLRSMTQIKTKEDDEDEDQDVEDEDEDED